MIDLLNDVKTLMKALDKLERKLGTPGLNTEDVRIELHRMNSHLMPRISIQVSRLTMKQIEAGQLTCAECSRKNKAIIYTINGHFDPELTPWLLTPIQEQIPEDQRVRSKVTVDLCIRLGNANKEIKEMAEESLKLRRKILELKGYIKPKTSGASPAEPGSQADSPP